MIHRLVIEMCYRLQISTRKGQLRSVITIRLENRQNKTEKTKMIVAVPARQVQELGSVEPSNEPDDAAMTSTGVRMYLVNAAERQRPKVWILESSMPARAAAVAAPIRKLWPVIPEILTPYWDRAWLTLLISRCLESGRPSRNTQRGRVGVHGGPSNSAAPRQGKFPAPFCPSVCIHHYRRSPFWTIAGAL